MRLLQGLTNAWVAILLVGACLGPRSADAQIRQAAQFTPGGNRLRQVETETLPPLIDRFPDVTANLKVIQRRSQLMITKSNVVRTAIADQRIVDIVQFSPTEMAFVGMGVGSTTVTIWFEDSPEPLIYLIEVITDPSINDQRNIDYGKLEEKLADLFPNSKVYLIPLHRKIVIKGQARNPEEASQILQVVAGEVINQNGDLFGPQAGGAGFGGGAWGNGFNGYDPSNAFNGNGLLSSFIINMMTVPGENQIALRVRVAELKRSMLRQFGVNFNALINDSGNFFSSAISGGTTTITGIFSSGDISVLINALELNGTAKILAEPNITVLSGHPASFLAGGEFAVPTIVGINGVGGQQTTFRGFGTSLVVVPTIMDRDLIRMNILPEFSAIDQSIAVNGVPGTNSRRVQTTVELREGQTIALAGLLSHQASTKITRIPIIGQIPIIGPLIFNDKQASQDETELLILVTPEIIRPMDPDEVPPVPGFEVTHPNNCELYWHAMTEGFPDKNVYRQFPLGRGTGNGIPVGYPAHNPGPGAGYPGQNYPNGGNQAPLTNGSLQGSPYGSPPGHPPAMPPARPGDVQGLPPNSQIAPNAGQNAPRGRPTPITPPSAQRRYDGHSAGPSLNNRATPAGYSSTRKPPARRPASSEQTDYRGNR
ncbi:MAG: pilus assembly protein N-terminal domain-containing protein [Planctomycetia bacterium]|nr:pilus assembly protein N-terminal domain-containing protein [Planctomycetia bacterium]